MNNNTGHNSSDFNQMPDGGFGFSNEASHSRNSNSSRGTDDEDDGSSRDEGAAMSLLDDDTGD